MTGMVIANLGILLPHMFSSFSFPFRIAATMAGLRFLGITPCFRWATLNPEMYWLIEAELTFLLTISHPTKVNTILSSIGNDISTPVSSSHLLT